MDLGSYLLANPWTFARAAQPGPQHTGRLPVQFQLALVSFMKEIKRDMRLSRRNLYQERHSQLKKPHVQGHGKTGLVYRKLQRTHFYWWVERKCGNK